VNLDFLIGSSLSSEPFFHVSIGPKIAEQVRYDSLEIFRGYEGDDLIDGGTGLDRVDYSLATEGMIFNLGSGTVSSLSQGTDTLRSVEEICATKLDDVFDATGFLGGYTSSTSNVGSDPSGFNAYIESGGNDLIIGNGFTRVDYRNSMVAIHADLGAGFVDARIESDKATDPYRLLGRDTLSGVYELFGSAYDDLLIGGGAGRAIMELATVESFRGGAGDDTIQGVAGHDVVSYANSPNAILIDLTLASGQAHDGWGFVDTLLNIDEIDGSERSDVIRGSSGSERFSGRKGNDSIDGDNGNDTLAGGLGNDSLDGGNGADIATFSGYRNNYLITHNTEGALTVADLRNATVPGFDGTDTLRSIETLRFNDADVAGTPAVDVSLSGITYHWKTHMLLSSMDVSARSREAVEVNGPPAVLDLRTGAVITEAGTGNRIVTVQVWGNAQASDANFDFRVASSGALAASFSSSLSPGWTVIGNTEAPNDITVAGFDSGTGFAAGPVQLGTPSLTFSPSVTRTDLTFSQIGLGEVLGPDLVFSMANAAPDSNGQWSISNLPSGSYSLTASRINTDAGNAITSADALAALRLAVGFNPNPDPDGAGPLNALRVSPYQFIAADVNGSNTVTSADALAILRMAVKLPTALPNEWFFVEESRDFWNEGTNSFTLTRTSAGWDRNIVVDPSVAPVVNLVGVLKGDVNGSWVAPAGSVDLDTVNPTYFNNLATSMDMVIGSTPVTDQWGV